MIMTMMIIQISDIHHIIFKRFVYIFNLFRTRSEIVEFNCDTASPAPPSTPRNGQRRGGPLITAPLPGLSRRMKVIMKIPPGSGHHSPIPQRLLIFSLPAVFGHLFFISSYFYNSVSLTTQANAHYFFSQFLLSRFCASSYFPDVPIFMSEKPPWRLRPLFLSIRHFFSTGPTHKFVPPPHSGHPVNHTLPMMFLGTRLSDEGHCLRGGGNHLQLLPGSNPSLVTVIVLHSGFPNGPRKPCPASQRSSCQGEGEPCPTDLLAFSTS